MRFENFFATYANWFRPRLKESFLKYVKFNTASNKESKTSPSSKGQIELAGALKEELADLQLKDLCLTEKGYLYGYLAGNSKKKLAPFVLLAHLDTTADVPAVNVKAQVISNYDGKSIKLKEGFILEPTGCPALLNYKGTTLITSDGKTLLGADDKAGIAIIVNVLKFLQCHPEILHGPIEFVFTPDEEIGQGTAFFPFEKIKANFGLTIDGNGEGIIEAECFSAWLVEITIIGRSVHLGEGRGKLINATEIAGKIISSLPAEESPQATDQRFGFYAVIEVAGNLETANLTVLIRDFEEKNCLSRLEVLRSLAAFFEKKHPGLKIKLKAQKQYSNMQIYLKKKDKIYLDLLAEAVKIAGSQPVFQSIRGGTDGARLTEKGILTPNLFNGGFNFHSRTEWLSLEAMTKAALSLVAFSMLWANLSDKKFNRLR